MNSDIKAVLFRIERLKDRTLGILTIYKNLKRIDEFVTLEPPWNGNLKNLSCITTGVFAVIPRESNVNGHCFQILDVPSRTAIQIHAGNFPINTEGCILIGNEFRDINRDKIVDLADSKKALTRLRAVAPDGFELTIT